MARIFENGISSRTTRRFLGTTALTAAGLALLSPAANAQDHAWSNFDTQHGSIDINTQVPNTTNITQHSNVYIGNSNNLDILSHQTVNIGQNSSNALFVARSVRESDDPTRILGSLNANGRVMVIDRNGVFMDPNSSVDVGSIIVSTGDVTNADILNDDGKYEFSNFGDGKIELNGSITVAEAGLAGFVSPMVSNNGLINAKMGKVVMAGGEKVTLDLYGDNLVEIAVDDKAADALLENAGTINAEGGTVLMTAQAAKDVTDNIINVSGVINASSATVKGGKIVLGGGGAGKVAVSGTLVANGKGGAGDIKVTGQDIEVKDTALMLADAVETGNGGDVYVFADNNTVFEGAVYARGGSQSGNGGSVEVSAKNQVAYDGSVNTTAANGTAGSFLIDPLFALIHSGTLHSPLGLNYILSAEALADDLARNGSLTVQADNFIDVGTTLSGLGIGDGPIDLANYNYNQLEYVGPNWWNWAVVNYSGITTGNITLDSNTVNFNKDVTIGRGNLAVDANTVNLNSQLFGYGTAPSMTTALLGDARISSNANTVNVLSNAAKIQQGIWLANDAGGATVDVAAGSYVQDSNLVINKALTLAGNQAGIDARLGSGLRTAGSPAETIIDLNGNRQIQIRSDNVIIDGFEVKNTSADMIYADTASGAGDANSNGSWDGLVVKNNILHDGGDEGVQLRDATGAIIEFNNVFDVDGDGLNMADASINGFIQDNEIYGTRSTNGQIYVYNSDNITIQRNYIHDITNPNNDAIKLGLDNFGDTNRFVGNVLNNRIHNVSEDGIAVYSSGALISGNEISGSSSTNGAIHIQSTNSNLPTNVVIENNYIHDNSTRGIRVSEAVNLNIRNNTFANNTGGHVVVRNSVNNANAITVFGNSFDSSGPFAVINETVGTLNASGNWWNTTNEAAVLARASGSVDITPYLALGTDTDLGTMGFQGDFSHLYATLLGAQVQTGGRINEAVALIADGSNTGVDRLVTANNGVYDETVQIGKDLTLEGTDRALTIIRPTTMAGAPGLSNGSPWAGQIYTPIVLAKDTGSVNVENLTIDGTSIGGNNSGTNTAGLTYYNAGGKAEDVTIMNAGAFGFYAVADSTKGHSERTVTAKNLSSFGNWWAALAAIGDNLITIIDGGIYSAAGANTALDLSNGSRGSVTGSTLSTGTYGERSGISFHGGHDWTITDTTINGGGAATVGIADDAAGYGVPAASNISISGGTISNVGIGIDAAGGSNWNVTGGTTITGAAGTNGAGISFAGLTGSNSIVDAIVSGFRNGIQVVGGSGTLLIDDNSVTGNTDTNAGRVASDYQTGIGIFLKGVGGIVDVVANTVTGNVDGIRVQDMDPAVLGDVTLEENIANNNSDKGIILKRSDNIEVYNNTVNGNNIGIYADASSGALIKANDINANIADGIRLRDGSNNVDIENNWIHGSGGAGIYVDNSMATVSGVRVYDNSFAEANGSEANVKNLVNTSANIVDASFNWWGSNVVANIVAKITGIANVDISPFQGQGDDMQLATPGYQGDNINLHVTTVGAHTGPYGRIQEAVDIAREDGHVIVEAGSYTENLMLDFDRFKLEGLDGAILNYDVANTGRGIAGNLITVDADDVSIDPFVFDGGGVAAYGTYADGDSGLIIDGNIYQNFTQAGIRLDNTTGALVTGNTLNNTGIYGVLLSGGTGATIEGGSISNTLWDSIRVLYAGNTTIQNIDLNNAGTSQGVNGVGSGIVFVGANGATVDNATITDIARLGIYAGASSNIILLNNTITNVGTGTNTSAGDSVGKFSGIHIEGTNNLTATNNTIVGATKDGINLGGLINAPYSGAVTGTVLVNENVINTTGEDGIDVTGGTGVDLNINFIGLTEIAPSTFISAGANNIKGDGIRVSSSNGATLYYNFIDSVAKNGINVIQGTGIEILNNILNKTGQVGIRTDQVATLDISDNQMDNIGWQGIQIEGGSAATVDANLIKKAGGKGIAVSGTNGSDVTDNTVYNIGESGIVVNGGKNSTIDGNVVYTVGTKGAGNWNGIETNGVGEDLEITNNFVGYTDKLGTLGTATNIRNNGIVVKNSTNAQVRSNDVATAVNGIVADLANGIDIYNNDITGRNSSTGTGVLVTNSSDINVGAQDQISISGPWWAPVLTITDRDNRIANFDTGVSVTGGNINDIVNNTISNVHNGVKISGSTNADVLDNTITGNSVTGIDIVAGSHGATVDGNSLTTFATGINVANSNNVTVTDNTLTDVLDGIKANLANVLRIRDNDLTGRGNLGTGINVTNSDDVYVGGYDLVSFLGFPIYQGNAVEDFRNGINAHTVTNLRIQGNRVEGDGSTGTGIKITNSNGALIGGTGTFASFLQSNFVTGFYDGIQSNNSDNAQIVRNMVEDSDGDGIRVDGLAAGDTGVVVRNNVVENVGRTGIWMKNQNNSNVIGNRVDGTGLFSGIRAEGGNTVLISDNYIDNTATHGVSATGVVNLDITDNRIGLNGGNIGSDGINVASSGGAEILRNRINDTAGEGIYLESSNGSSLNENRVNNTGSHGIHVFNSTFTFLRDNLVGLLGGDNSINGDGILVSGNSRGATITGNDVTNTTSTADGIGSGISVKGDVRGTIIGGAGALSNTIYDTAWDGIRVEANNSGVGTGVQVMNNNVEDVVRVGIWLRNTAGAQVNDNIIENTTLSGIRAENGSNFSALRNIINDTGTHGISTDNVATNVTLLGNLIGQLVANSILGNGIQIVNSDNATVGGAGADANRIKGATNGMVFDDVTGLITVDNNTVEDSTGVGIIFQGGTIGNVVMTGNTFTNNTTGGRFESGNFDLRGTSNIFQGGTTGMVFDRFGGVAPLSLVAGPADIPGTNGTFGSTILRNQTGQYIVFANNAFSNGFNNPIKLDASFVTFGTFIPNSKPRNGAGIPLLTQAEYDAIENKVTHFNDDGFLGQILFGQLIDINQEELFRVVDFDAFGMGGLNVRILGMPRIPGGPTGGGTGGGAAAFNNIAPFAGGEVNPEDLNNITPAAGGDGGGTTAQALNQIDTAAGGDDQQAACWGDAMNAVGAGQSVNLSYGSGMDDVLSGAANCGSDI